MHDNNQTKQTQSAVINYTAPRPVNIGDVFYMLKATDFQAFHEPCKVRGGKKELTVNGVTFKCPCCGSEKEILKIHRYVVRRFRVCAITDEVGSADWKPSTYHKVKFKLYRKVGKGYWGYDETRELHDSDFDKLNIAPEEINNQYIIDRAIYSDYNLAVSVAKKLTDDEIEKLKAYNAEYGSAHEAVFKDKNDPKSN